jgi:hypothetical protein
MPHSKTISFIATNRREDLFHQDPSYIYRCENLAQALKTRGYQTELIHIKKLSVKSAPKYAVFHRPSDSLKLRWLVKQLKTRGTITIADYDDLIINSDYSSYSPAVRNNILPIKKIKKVFDANRKALKLFDLITVSTEALSSKVKEISPQSRVTVIHNSVHYSWIERSTKELDNFSEKTITYFPGTRSHDRDFRLIAPMLERFLKAYPQTKLQITGHLNYKLDIPKSQIIKLPRVPFSEYKDHVRGGWVNLAPLENTPFNACKSALKGIEAGRFGIPTICSPNQDYERLTKAGAIIASSNTKWFDSLEMLMDRDAYQNSTSNISRKTLKIADSSIAVDTFINALQSNISSSS